MSIGQLYLENAILPCCGGSTISAFHPADLPNLWGWFKGDAGVFGSPNVTKWADQSGNGHDLSTTNSEPPVVQTGVLNSLPVIKKDTGNAWMITGAAVPDLSLSGATIYLVGRQPSTSEGNFCPFLGFGTDQSVVIKRNGHTADAVRFSVNSASGVVNNDRTGVSDAPYHTLRLRVDNVKMYASVNNDAETVVSCVLGAFAAGATLNVFSFGGVYGDKAIAEILLYRANHNAGERLQVESYLKAKYNHY